MTKQQWKTEHRRQRVARKRERLDPYKIAILTRTVEWAIGREYEELFGWGNMIPPEKLEKEMKLAAQRPENWFLR